MPLVAMADAVAGTVALSAEYNKLIDNIEYLDYNKGGMIAWGRRTTISSGSTGAAVAVLRVNMPIYNGRQYAIETMCHPNSTVSSDIIQVQFRYSTSGNATASSPILFNGEAFMPVGNPLHMRTLYQSTTNGTLSIALCIARFSGTGSVSLHADTNRGTDLFLYDEGLTLTDIGVDL